MADIKLHGDLVSQPTRAIDLMLRACNIPYEFVYVNFPKEEHKGEEYAKLNPLKHVPTLVVKGLPNIIESTAALQYLAGLEGVPEHWYPRGEKERLLVNMYLAWHGPDMRRRVVAYAWRRYVSEFTYGGNFPEDVIQNAKQNLEGVFDKLETIWLKDTAYLGGDEVSIADIQCITEIAQVIPTGFDVGKNRPKLSAYIDRVRARLQPHYGIVHDDQLAKFREFYLKLKASK